MKRVKNIGVIANPKKPNVKETVASFIEIAHRQGVSCLLEKRFKQICPEGDGFFSPQELVSRSDAVFAFGGDGTILFAAQFTGPSSIPLLGVNLGSLGFLTQVAPEQLEPMSLRVFNGDYQLDRRMVIEAACNRGTFFALNEVIIEKWASPRVITVELKAGRQLVGSYIADGLIISTPTGSTAHSLAAGGPILHPQVQAIVVTPLSPHSLTARPLVFPASTLFTVKVTTEGDRAVVVVDGQEKCQLQSGEEIKVKRAPHTVDLIDFQERSFYELLRTRFKWGG